MDGENDTCFICGRVFVAPNFEMFCQACDEELEKRFGKTVSNFLNRVAMILDSIHEDVERNDNSSKMPKM